MKFCCNDFEWRYSTSEGMGLNIRVVTLANSKNSRAFYITEGYTKGAINVKNARIKYCPFCGKNLDKFYSDIDGLENAELEDFLKLL